MGNLHPPQQSVSAGSTLPGALAISVKAEALQCDSHLPGKSAVILHSQSGVQAGRPGAHLQAPLLLQLEVCQNHALSTDAGHAIHALSIRDSQSCASADVHGWWRLN